MKQNRRNFIATVAAVSAAVPIASAFGKTFQKELVVQKYPLRIFSKVLDDYDFGFMCDCTLLSGIEGLDLTVRKGGKCEPSEVETKLPLLVDEAKKRGLAIDMIVTDISSADDPLTERVLKTASSLGVRWYRLGWQEYDIKAGILPSLDKGYKNLKGVAKLNEKYRIHGGYQNHTGIKIGSPVWDIHRMISTLNPDFIGCQYDVRHATVEGANSWIWGMRLLSPWIRTLAIKDMTWITGSGKPRAVTVPMGEGMVDWDLFFKTIKDYNIVAPMTLHIEYPLLDKSQQSLPLQAKKDVIVSKLKKDVAFINSYLSKYNLV